MGKTGITRVAEFVRADERRKVYVREGAGGVVAIGEESSGVVTQLAYGDAVHRSELHVIEAKLEPVLRRLTGESSLVRALHTLFADEEVSLTDLMDECDARRIGYWYLSMGDATGVSLRRSRVA